MRQFLQLWVFIGILAGISSSELVKRQSNGVQSNSMSLEPGESHDPPVIDIDERPTGSGGEENAWPDDDEYSGDDDDGESGSGPDDIDEAVAVTTTTPKQVHTTPKKKPEKPNKPKKPLDSTSAPAKATTAESDKENKIPDSDDITVDPGDKMTTISNEVVPGDDGNNVEFSTGPPNGLADSQAASSSFMELLFTNPAILAAIIAGAVIALLSAILLVMFIVYRMRKKDEGSYSLDEPKKYKDPNMYWKDTGKEFYA
ncbi:syndecan-2-like [Ptychodera flava]|uniref:syndecan-2-like n=1 Tax=Ptychodera flava TaxID=63121 RepID=UPI00396A3052